MAKLKPCRDCGQQISKKAASCPHCGAPTKAKGIGCVPGLFIIVVAVGVISAILTPKYPDPTPPPPATSVVCLDVSQALIDQISSTLEVGGGGQISRARAVQSGAHEIAYFIAGQIEGSGLTDAVGVWASNSLDGSGAIFSVDNMAKEFSVLPDGGSTAAAFSMSDPGARESEQCLDE